jgi:hypothetical protein
MKAGIDLGRVKKCRKNLEKLQVGEHAIKQVRHAEREHVHQIPVLHHSKNWRIMRIHFFLFVLFLEESQAVKATL